MPRILKIAPSDAKHIAIDLFTQLMKTELIDQSGSSMEQVTRLITEYLKNPIQLHSDSATTVEDVAERVWFHHVCGGMLVQMDKETWVCDKCGARTKNPEIGV